MPWGNSLLLQFNKVIISPLREHIIIKADIAEIKQDVAGLRTGVSGLTTNVAEIKAMQTGFDSKLDLILSKLQ
jgi:hypothetical protein